MSGRGYGFHSAHAAVSADCRAEAAEPLGSTNLSCLVHQWMVEGRGVGVEGAGGDPELPAERAPAGHRDVHFADDSPRLRRPQAETRRGLQGSLEVGGGTVFGDRSLRGLGAFDLGDRVQVVGGVQRPLAGSAHKKPMVAQVVVVVAREQGKHQAAPQMVEVTGDFIPGGTSARRPSLSVRSAKVACQP